MSKPLIPPDKRLVEIAPGKRALLPLADICGDCGKPCVFAREDFRCACKGKDMEGRGDASPCRPGPVSDSPSEAPGSRKGGPPPVYSVDLKLHVNMVGIRDRGACLFEMPLRTISEANAREHWAPKAKRARVQRETARLSTLAMAPYPRPPLTITLTRLGKRTLDTDNLARSFKAIRDGIAEALGIDDGDPRLDWQYGQEIAKKYSVRVDISEAKKGGRV